MNISIKDFTKNYYNRHTHKKNCLLKRKNSRGDKWSWWVCRTHRWDSGLTHTPNQSWQQNPNVKVFLLFIICRFLKDFLVFATGSFLMQIPHKLLFLWEKSIHFISFYILWGVWAEIEKWKGVAPWIRLHGFLGFMGTIYLFSVGSGINQF